MCFYFGYAKSGYMFLEANNLQTHIWNPILVFKILKIIDPRMQPFGIKSKNWVTNVLMYLSWLNLTMLHLDLCFLEKLGYGHTFVILCPFTELVRLSMGFKRGHKATMYLYNLMLYYAFIILGCIWLRMHVDNLVPSIMIHKVMITRM